MTTTLAVCIKAAWRTDTALRLAESGKAVNPDGVVPGISPTDASAFASALTLRNTLKDAGKDTRLVVVTVGPSSAEGMLRDALAAGADEVMRIRPAAWPSGPGSELDGSTRATHTKALLVADALRILTKTESLLAITGDASPDEGHATFGAYLAHALGLDFAHRANLLEPTVSGWRAIVKLERGYSQEVKLGSSAVVTCANTGMRLPDAPWPAWLASRRADIPLVIRENPSVGTATSVTALRAPIPRVKRYRVPDSDLSAEARIRALMSTKSQGGGTVLPASEGLDCQIEAAVNLLKARGYLPEVP